MWIVVPNVTLDMSFCEVGFGKTTRWISKLSKQEALHISLAVSWLPMMLSCFAKCLYVCSTSFCLPLREVAGLRVWKLRWLGQGSDVRFRVRAWDASGRSISTAEAACRGSGTPSRLRSSPAVPSQQHIRSLECAKTSPHILGCDYLYSRSANFQIDQALTPGALSSSANIDLSVRSDTHRACAA